MNVGKHIKYEVATSKVINLDFDSFLEENPLVKKQKMYKNKRNERMVWKLYKRGSNMFLILNKYLILYLFFNKFLFLNESLIK